MQDLTTRISQKAEDMLPNLRYDLLTSLEAYTRVMFKAQQKRNFIVSYHHKLLFEALQDVVDGKCKRLIINMPPRYGKTEVVVKAFISWCFALNPKSKFLHLSYSDVLVNDNSETIRNIMLEPLYKQLFPNSVPASEKGSTKRWKTKAGGELYAVSTQGQVTGFGAGAVDLSMEDQLALIQEIDVFNEGFNEALEAIGAVENAFQGAIVIDDPVKPEDAESDIVRERINNRFESTIRNRVNSPRNTPIIIIMQRLHPHDLSGYLMEAEPDEWRVLSMPAIRFNEETQEREALWPMKHTLEELDRLRDIDPITFDTQYMQDAQPREGLMYGQGFRTYTPEELPSGVNASRKWNYTDTADTGSDMLCSICFIDTPEMCYVTDVLFTDAPMEVTEKQVPQMLTKNGTVRALIEANNGGRGFARKVKQLLRTTFHNFHCVVSYFHQGDNKQVRIFTNSAGVMSDIAFPVGWEKKWPKFYSALITYHKEAKKGTHDDAPDCLTGVYEMHSRKFSTKKIKCKNS